MMSLTRAGSSTPGKLDDDAVAALRRDVRLGDAEGVDAVVDRLDRVRDRVALDGRDCDAVFILNCIAPSGVRLTSNGRRGSPWRCARTALVGVSAGSVATNVVSFTRRVVGIGRLVFFACAFSISDRLIGLEADGVADVDAHDQMRAALQVEAAADRLRVVLVGIDRGGEADEDSEDQDDFPQQTSSQDFLQEERGAVTRPHRPW